MFYLCAANKQKLAQIIQKPRFLCGKMRIDKRNRFRMLAAL
jgi:hypothetical protein